MLDRVPNATLKKVSLHWQCSYKSFLLPRKSINPSTSFHKDFNDIQFTLTARAMYNFFAMMNICPKNRSLQRF